MYYHQRAYTYVVSYCFRDTYYLYYSYRPLRPHLKLHTRMCIYKYTNYNINRLNYVYNTTILDIFYSLKKPLAVLKFKF